MDSMPSRPLRVHELKTIEEDEDIQNTEPLYYEEDNVNAAICFMITSAGKAHLIGYDRDEESWEQITVIGSEGGAEEYKTESDGIIKWIEKIYGEDGYGVYGHDDVIE